MSDAVAAPVATWRDWLALTKPKVVALLLFTALGSMWIAARGFPGWLPLTGVLIGGAMVSGGAGVFNMVLERDLDARMKRTMRRPLVRGVISVRGATLFGAGLGVGALAVLWLTTNPLTVLAGLGGLGFYVLVYTLWLKRRTWQNIVLGGMAGAVPPLLGWAAVTGELSPLAWALFALIFLWTPVHFWALAFLVREQYAAAGVPMAPVVLGTTGTLRQMSLYTLLTSLSSLAPLMLGEAGWLYGGMAAALNLLLLWKMAQLGRRAAAAGDVTRADCLGLYKFSMLYLALVFLSLGLDRSLLPLVIAGTG